MTTIFLIVTIVVSAIAFQNREVYGKLLFNPYLINTQRQWYRFFSSGFIHSDLVHLAINMFVLYSFGGVVEYYFNDAYGEKAQFYYIVLYISSIMMALLPTYNNHKTNPGYNGLGASGAVSAIVFSSIVFDPTHDLALYGIIRLPAILFGILYLAYCFYMGKRGGDNVNHSAHLWGAIYGFSFTIFLKPSLIIDFFDKLIYFRNAI